MTTVPHLGLAPHLVEEVAGLNRARFDTVFGSGSGLRWAVAPPAGA